MTRHGFVPEYLYRNAATYYEREAAGLEEQLGHRATLLDDTEHADALNDLRRHAQRYASMADRAGLVRIPPAGTDPGVARLDGGPDTHARLYVYDAGHDELLPGEPVWHSGMRAPADPAVTESLASLGWGLRLLREHAGRNSLDGRGGDVLVSVHYGIDYCNAFWDGAQMVYGDGDGVLFRGFTDSVDIGIHELQHGVTQELRPLRYWAQSGALNEAVSDLVGSAGKQKSLRQRAADADWLIGSGIFTPKVHGRALRDMLHPGTAYDDPVIGRDPQPDHLDEYVTTLDDEAGVHINSGICDRAFALAAIGCGGHTYGRNGFLPIVLETMRDAKIREDCTFAVFANANLAAAVRLHGPDSRQAAAVSEAWQAVGVLDTDGRPTKQALALRDLPYLPMEWEPEEALGAPDTASMRSTSPTGRRVLPEPAAGLHPAHAAATLRPGTAEGPGTTRPAAYRRGAVRGTDRRREQERSG